MHHEVVTLHWLAGVTGATRLLPAAGDGAMTSGGAEARDTVTWGRGPSGGSGAAALAPAALYEGGSLSEVLERASDAADAAGAAQPRPGKRAARRSDRRAGAELAPPVVPPVLLFHGVCGWAEGQLEGAWVKVHGLSSAALLGAACCCRCMRARALCPHACCTAHLCPPPLLAGELRAGTWSFLPAGPATDVLHLLSLPPDQLWPTLANSPGLVSAR